MISYRYKKVYKSSLVLAALLFVGITVRAQEITVSGVVTETQSGESLSGVNIAVKGTTIGTTTDADGSFELTVPSINDTLRVSFVGYRTKEVAINGRENLGKIVLQPQAIKGEEMVVVGYGEEQKINLTGSVSSVNSSEFASRPVQNTSTLLEGQMSGVTVSQSSGQPGRQSSNFLIRGIGTTNNNEPMVLIDGIEVNDIQAALADLNPSDIENVSVLKDAASAAIYGTRAANGVILITTKRGEEGQLRVSYDMYAGWQTPTRLPQLVSSANYARLVNESNRYQGLPQSYSEEDIDKFESGKYPYKYPDTDWVDATLQGSGFTQNHNLSFSGGNEESTYRVSLGYNEQKGNMKKANSDRYNLRANLDSKITDWFDIGLTANLSRREVVNPTNRYGTGTGLFFDTATRMSPMTPIRLEDGGWGSYLTNLNTVAWIEDGGKATLERSRVLGNIFGEADLVKGLSLNGTANISYNLGDYKQHVTDYFTGAGTYQGPNSVTDRLERTSIISLEALLKYDRRFAKHGFKGLLGVQRRDQSFKRTQAYRKDFASNALTGLTAGSTVGWSNDGSLTESKLISFFGRIKYDFDHKYLFEANLRRDGSSKFGRGNRWGWFPSFSAGWRLTEERFMENISWLNELKLRASWGKLGNHSIGNYQYIPRIALGQDYNFGGTVAPGAAQTSPANPDITWETTTERDFGVDIGLFQNSLSITADYYNRYTDDILATVPVSNVYGLPAPITNAGAMRNRGVELQLSYNNTIGNFGYNISGNSAYNKNVLEEYDNPSVGSHIRKEGVSWNSYYGYEWIGYFQSDEEAANSATQKPDIGAGELKYKDQNGDGTINGDDRIVLGNSVPEITYGFKIGANFKGIDFSVFFKGVARSNKKLAYVEEWPFVNGYGALQKHLDRTIVRDGKIVKQGHYPITTKTTAFDRPTSNFWVHDASYLRLQNLHVGYSLPASWINSLKISKAKIYFSGENLFLFTHFPENFDPETPDAQGGFIYPQVQTYTFGLDVNF